SSAPPASAMTPTLAPAATPAVTSAPTADPLTGIRHPMTELHAKRLIAEVQVGGEPDWQVFADGSLWVATGGDGHVVRVDAATNTVSAKVAVAEPCVGMAAGFGSVWAPSCGGKPGVARIDPKTNTATLISTPAIPDSEGQIVASDDAIWLMSGTGLTRIDPATNAVSNVEISGGPIASVVWASGSLWATAPGAGQVLQLDAAGSVLQTVKVGAGPRFEAVGEGAVWTLNQYLGDVSRIDPATASVVATIAVEVPGDGGCIAAGEGGVWVTMPDYPFARIDPATNAVTEQYFGPGGDCIGVGGGSVWLSNHGSGTVWRVSPP
ncbi:MAG TPA: hypothetical protein VF484_03800, partial [Candidatus Limnocylindrales bacterium]